jgi:sortase (surface protein transpeptidase)
MTERQPRRRLRLLLAVLSGGLLVVAGLGLAPSHPAQHRPRLSQDAAPAGAVAPLPRSTPLQLVIPSLRVDAPLLGLGLDTKGAPELPPFTLPKTAAWLRDSATPGERGTAVLLGHVDTRTGPAVFWGLSALKRGAAVEVSRVDGRTAVFTVDRTASYSKAAFPSAAVYGPAADAQLRLITCGGAFDASTQQYRGNVVVYAHLTGVRG